MFKMFRTKQAAAQKEGEAAKLCSRFNFLQVATMWARVVANHAVINMEVDFRIDFFLVWTLRVSEASRGAQRRIKLEIFHSMTSS